ncbi:MAG: TOM (translocase of outer membrane) complex component [Trizodia sp. TS-e1964]|nr:MAG: TOM (translocase of outer membrane) complex component [Trizodia sp. TS-e1964]
MAGKISDVNSIPIDSSSAPTALWDRLSNWASENKAVVYTVSAVVVVVTSAGIVYYLSEAKKDSDLEAGEKKKSRKERRKAKKDVDEFRRELTPKSDEDQGEPKPVVPIIKIEDTLPPINETSIETFTIEERNDYASKLKAAGNAAYGSKKYTEAIELYGKAILLKPDAVFYSNRAACFNALGDWEKVIEDTSAALALNSEYVKALNRRANAYEQLTKYREALLDFTASCIIDQFRNEVIAQSVERLLKKVAETKTLKILAERKKRLPSAAFITNYLQTFRPKPLPTGLEITAALEEESGKGQLQKGLLAMDLRTAIGYDEAAQAFERAIELGELENFEALAYNMRGTFKFLAGDTAEALDDLTESVKLEPTSTQAYIKRALIYMELGDRQASEKDFEDALLQNPEDPDFFYHRAQLHFVLGDFAEAAKDYQKSIDLDSSFIYAHIQLGVTQYKLTSVASSMATFRRCIKNFHKVPDVYNYYGELLLDQQKYQEAIEKFDMAMEMEKQTKLTGMNVIPLVNKALALFHWKKDFAEAEKLCQKALILDPDCDIAVATMAQLLLQQSKVVEALTYFERAAELSRTEGEIVNALSYAEATRTQLEVQEKYPQLASRLQAMSGAMGSGPR